MQNKKVIVTCDNCNKDFEQYAIYYNRAKLHCCTLKCRDEYRIKIHLRKCLYCGKEYHRRLEQKEHKYCSIGHQKLANEDTVIKVCEVCWVDYEIPKAREGISRFCSDECRKIELGRVASSRIANLHPNYKGLKDEDRPDMSRLLTWGLAIKRRDKVCTKCGATDNLHAHHKIPYKVDRSKMFELDNGITLCSECHAREHRGQNVSHLIRRYKREVEFIITE